MPAAKEGSTGVVFGSGKVVFDAEETLNRGFGT